MLIVGIIISGDSVDTVTVAMEDKVVGMDGLVVIKVPAVGTSVTGLAANPSKALINAEHK